MRPYFNVLGKPDFRRLWIGATVSTVGDAMTFIALSWLVLSMPGGTARLGVLGICYTAPVLLGGLAVGPLLDRFDKRMVLITDCLVRAVAVASVPLADAVGSVPGWLLFVVAAIYGLLKMIPLAGFPAAIPQLVDDADLDSANALESLSFSIAGVAGPATAGLLIAKVDPTNVLLIDSASFLVFALLTARVRRPLRPQAVMASGDPPSDPPPRPPSFASVVRDRAIVATTVAFMAFNVAEGMLMVTAPWLAKNDLPAGAPALGIMLSATAVGEIFGATVAGRRGAGRSPVRAIGMIQLGAASAFLALLASPRQVPVGLGFFAVGLLSAPMTIWAQSLRMRRIPPALHGRAFATLRTLMQATPPLGAALVTPLLVRGQPNAAAVAMAGIAAVPALYLIFGDAARSPAGDLVTHELSRDPQ
jgi:MFS family permease